MKTSFFTIALQWMFSPLARCQTGVAALLGTIRGQRQAASGQSSSSTGAGPPPQLPAPSAPPLPTASSPATESKSSAPPVPLTPSPRLDISPPQTVPSASPTTSTDAEQPAKKVQDRSSCIADPATLSPNSSPLTSTTTTDAMAAALRETLQQLTSASPRSPRTASLLSTAKKQLMQLGALIPSAQTPPTLLPLARATLEAGALLSIAAQDPDAFTRYYMQLGPFYSLPDSAYQPASAAKEHQRSKITGLYLLLLLTKGDYAGFHTLLEGLQTESAQDGSPAGLEGDRFIRYPVELEQALMEGAYDRVWEATKGEGVPSKEFGVFSEVLIGTIRSEIASCSEKAYPSIPVVNAKNLLFLDSEGGVVDFAHERGWSVRDGRIYFPTQNENVRSEREILVASGTVIENTIGYARELETIV